MFSGIAFTSLAIYIYEIDAKYSNEQIADPSIHLHVPNDKEIVIVWKIGKFWNEITIYVRFT